MDDKIPTLCSPNFPAPCFSFRPQTNKLPTYIFSSTVRHFLPFSSLITSMSPALLLRKWAGKATRNLHSSLSFLVFLFLDFLEILCCLMYRFLDLFFEGKPSPCYCQEEEVEEKEIEMSETLFGRINVFRKMGFLGFPMKWEVCKKACGGGGGERVNRWSDCGCESCVSWKKNGGGKKLYVVVREPSKAGNGDCNGCSTQNVIFLHGFLCSSSLWTETVFPNLSEHVNCSYRLFAVDLLGFGGSPKPRECLYTLRDHLEMIEKSVIDPFELESFHLVAHSMGCIIALALAAKHPELVKSVTLVAPPYFTNSKEGASSISLQKLAGKRLWPPLLFGASFMSWYEHLGRCVCLLICRNHRTWEGILKLLTFSRDLHFMIKDLTRHTHHSAWHTMHNVICGGAKYMDDFLETLIKFEVRLCIIQGDSDQVVPLECSHNIKNKVPAAEVSIIPNADHNSVIMGREKSFTQSLEHIWASADDAKICLDNGYS